MPKTEIQTLTAKISAEYIRANGFNPTINKLADVPDTGFEFFWRTTAVCDNVHAARKVRMPEQRIVRNPTATYPATVVCKVTRKPYHVFNPPEIPYDDVRRAALARLRAADAQRAANAPRSAE